MNAETRGCCPLVSDLTRMLKILVLRCRAPQDNKPKATARCAIKVRFISRRGA